MKTMTTPDWVKQADKRAALRARQVAIQTNTALVFFKDGKIVKVRPQDEKPIPEGNDTMQD